MIHEEETIRAFIKRSKRERYLGFVSHASTRTKFTYALAHFSDFEPKYIWRIAPSRQNPKEIERILRAKGSPGLCYLISEHSELDKREFSLSEALEEIVGRGMGTILSCIAGYLAFVETEDERYILERARKPLRGTLYVRFVTPQIDSDSRHREGIFVAAYRLKNSGFLPKYQYDELVDDLDWFAENLPVPTPLERGRTTTAISWFRPDSKECITRVWSMVQILEDNGIVIKKITSERPGWVIYHDKHQLLTEPRR